MSQLNPKNPSSGAANPRPEITCLTLGPYETNCYVVSFPPDPACWIIDASFDPGPILDTIRRRALKPAALILTHAHIDHIAGADEVVAGFPRLDVFIHEAEREWLSNPTLNLSLFSGNPVTGPKPTRLLKHGETLTLAGQPWSVLHTPGHSPGSITLHHAPSHVAFVGDALFNGSIGRTDFPGCSFDTLAKSIRTHLYTLPDQTTILPGHGPSSTIAHEKRTNPFVKP